VSLAFFVRRFNSTSFKNDGAFSLGIGIRNTRHSVVSPYERMKDMWQKNKIYFAGL
jgi:hypothetical protein